MESFDGLLKLELKIFQRFFISTISFMLMSHPSRRQRTEETIYKSNNKEKGKRAPSVIDLTLSNSPEPKRAKTTAVKASSYFDKSLFPPRYHSGNGTSNEDKSKDEETGHYIVNLNTNITSRCKLFLRHR